ncbi:MAG: hypothetical protein JXB48_22245 [Candidatus Latescibacteria bacterium]|nr:hypothetical protein [Candidatus Latescibacterota bacterium]
MSHSASLNAGKILIVVEQGYYKISTAKIRRYCNDMKIEEKRTSEIVVFPSSGTITDLWNEIRDQYAAAKNSSTPITGAVLVGNLPIALFYYFGATIPSEYFFMDVWDNRSIPASDHVPHAYRNWTDVWELYQSSNLLNRELYKTNSYGDGGDGVLDLWVSRIYASNLPHLRDDRGNTLTEYQILSRYFDRLHKRMTGPSLVPPRGMSMGPPPSWPSRDLSRYARLENLGLSSIITYDYSDPSKMHLNQAAAWQAQLQAGPYGNSNHGVINGHSFSSEQDKANRARSCINEYYKGDQRGFEWAALFSHSIPTTSVFHMYDNSGYSLGGKFTSINNQQQWILKTHGGYKNGTYYENFQQGESVEWSCVMAAGRGGQYELYLYWNVDTLSNSSNNYLKFWGEKKFSLLVNKILDQSSSGKDNWNRIESENKTDYTINDLDTLVVGLYPNLTGFNRRNRCVADAIQFRLVRAKIWDKNAVRYSLDDIATYRDVRYICRKDHISNDASSPKSSYSGNLWGVDTNSISNYTITITPNEIFDINKRGMKGFRCNNWYNRSFCDMVFDGGPSKVPFFILVACWITSYHIPDNLGNLFAMGYAGLTAIGNSYESPLDTNGQFQVYTQLLGPDSYKCFGEAYLAQAQQAYTINNSFPDANFILLGAGNLYARAYH